MLKEPTSLANVVDLVADTLRLDYNIDPGPIFEELGLQPNVRRHSGERLPNSQIVKLWEVAESLCADPALGVKAGLRSQPVHMHVIGYAWMASRTLVEALDRMVRYESILDSGHTEISFEKVGSEYILSESYPNVADYIGQKSVDFAIASIVSMCRQAAGVHMRLRKLEVLETRPDRFAIYDDLVDGKVESSTHRNAMHFPASVLESPLPGALPELSDATTEVAEKYLEELSPNEVTYRVRQLLVQMLPSGSVSQEDVASRLHRSASTLQRQLQSEGTTYREVSEAARRSLAETYLRTGKYSVSQIAFLTGFGDQSNFSRAFKRWTGMTPRSFQKAGTSEND